MKVVRKSNWNHEDYRADQYFVAQHLCKQDAQAVADLLNERGGPYDDNYYDVVEDSYVLPKDWEP